MVNTTDYSILDASYNLVDISNDIGKFKIKLCKDFDIPYKEIGFEIITPTDDYRFIALDAIQQNIMSLVGYIRGFMELQRRINHPPEFLRVLNLGVTGEQFEKIIYKFPIESLTTMIHFRIDSYFGEVCTQKNKRQNGFYNKMAEVLKNIDKEDSSKNILQCFSYFRNSFHNKGIHFIHDKRWDEIKTQEDKSTPNNGRLDRTFKSEKLKIEFKHNEAIDYNWKSMILLMNESVKILMEVIYEMSKKN